jgi:hypothetical protein
MGLGEAIQNFIIATLVLVLFIGIIVGVGVDMIRGAFSPSNTIKIKECVKFSRTTGKCLRAIGEHNETIIFKGE